ncbi:hypothetical protein Hanom_Chr04g00284101 [Helianthus anomalus]
MYIFSGQWKSQLREERLKAMRLEASKEPLLESTTNSGVFWQQAEEPGQPSDITEYFIHSK